EIPRSNKGYPSTHIPHVQLLHRKAARTGTTRNQVFRIWSVGTPSQSCKLMSMKYGSQDVTATLVMAPSRIVLETVKSIPLRWMIQEIFKTEVGILFHRSMFQQIGMD
ncbi:hypothetical protein M404DRAFT_972070, partial [Pisolithus tinctorius Marx 270]